MSVFCIPAYGQPSSVRRYLLLTSLDSTADPPQNYSVSEKKGATLTMAITLSVLDRFAKFFHCCKEQ